MPRLVTVVKVALMSLPSKKSGGRVWPPTAAVGKGQGNGFDKRHSTCSFSGEDSDSDTDDYYTELSSSSSDEVWLYSCICVI